jgi:hypothetical protein
MEQCGIARTSAYSVRFFFFAIPSPRKRFSRSAHRPPRAQVRIAGPLSGRIGKVIGS